MEVCDHENINDGKKRNKELLFISLQIILECVAGTGYYRIVRYKSHTERLFNIKIIYVRRQQGIKKGHLPL